MQQEQGTRNIKLPLTTKVNLRKLGENVEILQSKGSE